MMGEEREETLLYTCRYQGMAASFCEEESHRKLVVNTQLPEIQQTLQVADRVGRLIQLRSPGFLSNARQHRQFGLTVIHMVQVLRQRWDVEGVKEEEDVEEEEGATREQEVREEGEEREYRGWMNIAVRYRQLSEPNDPVWWVDKLPRRAFTEGFGLQTPLFSGQMAVPRYFPYFARTVQACVRAARHRHGVQLNLAEEEGESGEKDIIAGKCIAEGNSHEERREDGGGRSFDRAVTRGEEVETNEVEGFVTCQRMFSALGGDWWVAAPCLSSLPSRCLPAIPAIQVHCPSPLRHDGHPFPQGYVWYPACEECKKKEKQTEEHDKREMKTKVEVRGEIDEDQEELQKKGWDLEGTRLTLRRTSPPLCPALATRSGGYDLTIRTPGTPDRYTRFENELQEIFSQIGTCVRKRNRRRMGARNRAGGCRGRERTMADRMKGERREKEGEEDVANEDREELESIARLCLHFFYYWVTFGPLTRGSAATGYAALVALLTAGGLPFPSTTGNPGGNGMNNKNDDAKKKKKRKKQRTKERHKKGENNSTKHYAKGTGAWPGDQVPPGLQMDWEAILSPSPSHFSQRRGAAWRWITPAIDHALQCTSTTTATAVTTPVASNALDITMTTTASNDENRGEADVHDDHDDNFDRDRDGCADGKGVDAKEVEFTDDSFVGDSLPMMWELLPCARQVMAALSQPYPS